MTVELLPQDAEFVAAEVSSGRYPNSTDLIRETIAEFKARREAEEKLATLRALIQEAWDESETEEGIELDPVEVLARIRSGQ